MTDVNPMELYTGLRDELIDLVRSLTPSQCDMVVALTPGWTVREVVAHVCGLNADVSGGARTNLGSDEVTARQVAERSEHSVEDICTEWLSHADGMQRAIDEESFFGLRLSADLVVHLHDVQHALGLPVDRESVGSISGGQTYGARTPDRLVEVAGVWLGINLTDGSRFEPSTLAPDGMRTLTLEATPHDVLRSVTGRRSRREVRALHWSGDPGDLLDVLSPYGPLRHDDAGI